MRGTILRALPVCVLAFTSGCFLLGNSPFGGTPPQQQTETHVYWQKVNEALSRRPATQDVPAMLKLIREQNAALGELSPEGVDKDLVAAVEELIRCEQDVLEKAEWAGNNVENLKQSQFLAAQFAGANRKAADVKKRLRALREPLNSKYGGGFAAMGG
jgi:hypothetical protein